ncbi:hypothetical protein Leryth_008053 [Lithospermum erythrorhizon]|nr:hypothetical protein Leryth_008053 [Lithospermum erythrorhizon]
MIEIIRWIVVWKMVVELVVLAFINQSSASLSPTGINYEVVALMAIKSSLHDPHNSMGNWDTYSVEPCSWRMITCSSNGYVSILSLPGMNLSGTLSPDIEKLSNLQSILLQNNAISGPIPETIGNLEKLQALDLSNNTFTGEVPSSLGNLLNLNYLRLNNNNLSGAIPQTLSTIDGLTVLYVLSLLYDSWSSIKILSETIIYLTLFVH